MTAARRTTATLTTADGAYSGANDDTSAYHAQAAAAPRAPGARSGTRNVFQPPLSAGGVDGHLRARAQRKQVATRIAALGTIAAVAVVALIAWRRARR
jgi:hypothetical protein